jgi:L-ascorbate metabolism protein UlaG (beta-lactamase superfamily)
MMTTGMGITFLGHASLLIDMDGEQILTDPLLRKRVWHLQRQRQIIDQSFLDDISAVLISHAHSDHMDFPSLRMLDQDTRIIAPRGTAQLLKKGGIQNVQEIARGESFNVGKVMVTATHAEHDGARFRYSKPAETVGYMIEGAKRIYFAGDTDLFPEMAELAPDLDIALLPVWGWGPNLGSGHLDPHQAAQALKLLKPALAIPIHWGTFFPFGLKWIMPRILSEPPRAFAAFAKRFAPEVEVLILEPGESYQPTFPAEI